MNEFELLQKVKDQIDMMTGRMPRDDINQQMRALNSIRTYLDTFEMLYRDRISFQITTNLLR